MSEELNMKFEDAMKELENIASKLERGDEDLDNAIKLYERGVKLKGFCDLKLKDAKMKVDVVNNPAEQP